jgi:hypothetical protein
MLLTFHLQAALKEMAGGGGCHKQGTYNMDKQGLK